MSSLKIFCCFEMLTFLYIFFSEQPEQLPIDGKFITVKIYYFDISVYLQTNEVVELETVTVY